MLLNCDLAIVLTFKLFGNNGLNVNDRIDDSCYQGYFDANNYQNRHALIDNMQKMLGRFCSLVLYLGRIQEGNWSWRFVSQSGCRFDKWFVFLSAVLKGVCDRDQKSWLIDPQLAPQGQHFPCFQWTQTNDSSDKR